MKTLILIIICFFCATTYASATSYEQNSLEKPDNVVILQRKIQKEPEKTNTYKVIPTKTTQPKIKTTTKITITKNPVTENSSTKNIQKTRKNIQKSCKDTPGTRCYKIKHRAKARPYPKGDSRFKRPKKPRPKQPAKPREIIHCY